MAQGAGDLLDQLVVQAIDQVADVVLDVADVQVLPPPVAGIEDVQQIAEDLDDGLAAGQRLVAEVAGAAALGVGGDNAFGDFRQRFFQSDVGGHRMLTLVGRAAGGLAGSSPSRKRLHVHARRLAQRGQFAPCLSFGHKIDKVQQIRPFAQIAGKRRMSLGRFAARCPFAPWHFRRHGST